MKPDRPILIRDIMLKMARCDELKTGVTLDAEEVSLLGQTWRALMDDVNRRGAFDEVMAKLIEESHERGP